MKLSVLYCKMLINKNSTERASCPEISFSHVGPQTPFIVQTLGVSVVSLCLPFSDRVK